MSFITDPYESIKKQALKIWDTKDFAERLAQSRTTWFLHMMYCLMIITVLWTGVILVVNDLFVLYNHYYGDSFWLMGTIEEIYNNIHPLIEMAILYFWVCPIIVRTTLTISKKYGDKEKAFFEYIETLIKKKYPNFKTSAQKARERELNPRKKGKLKIKFDAFMEKRNDVEKMVIRVSLWAVYCAILGSFIFFMLSTTSSIFNEILNPEQAEKEAQELEELKAEIQDLKDNLPPQRPDSLPPPTIFDFIFINDHDKVIP